MRITVDMSLCRGYAICVGLAPEHFEIDDAGDLVVTRSEVPPENEDAVRESAMICPMQAILLTEDA